MASAPRLTLARVSGHFDTTVGGPAAATGAPRKGSVCMTMMITPIPDMNPDITE